MKKITLIFLILSNLLQTHAMKLKGEIKFDYGKHGHVYCVYLSPVFPKILYVLTGCPTRSSKRKFKLYFIDLAKQQLQQNGLSGNIYPRYAQNYPKIPIDACWYGKPPKELTEKDCLELNEFLYSQYFNRTNRLSTSNELFSITAKKDKITIHSKKGQ